jgi:hypothetical protein
LSTAGGKEANVRKKLQDSGLTKALPIDEEMLARLGAIGESELEVEILGKVMIVSRPDLEPRDLKFALALMELVQEEDGLLRRLAE